MEGPRILVLAEGQLGDLLLLTPALRALKLGHPRGRLTVLVFQRRLPRPPGEAHLLMTATGRGTSAVLTGLPEVDEVLEVDRSLVRTFRGRKRVLAELSVVRQMRARRFDLVICTFPEDRFFLLAWASGARTRVGEHVGGLGLLLNVRVAAQRAAMGVRDYYCALASAAGGDLRSTATAFLVSEEADLRAAARLREIGIGERPWAAVHPGASGDYKIWPPERYAALIDRLIAGGLDVVLLGGDADDRVLSAIAAALPRLPATLRTGDDVGLLAACLRRSALCISNDSGPRHLAVAVGTPSLALFRRFQEREWGVYAPSTACVTLTGSGTCPLCPEGRCADRVPPGATYGAECLRQVDVESVAARALAMVTAVSGGTPRTSSGGTDRSGRA